MPVFKAIVHSLSQTMYQSYFKEIEKQAKKHFLKKHCYGITKEGFPLLRLDKDGSGHVIITAGFHGDEQAGPLTILEKMGEIVTLAKEKALTLYPCVNPEGFHYNTRYNAQEEKSNNDFVRYVTTKGTITDQLSQDEEFTSWFWAPARELPRETRLLQDDLRKQLPVDILLDLHQDAFIKEQGSYAYVDQKKTEYVRIARKIVRRVHLLKNRDIASGYDTPMMTDDFGLIVRRDGSITDLATLLGAQSAVAVETTTAVPLEDAIAVNMIWIEELLRTSGFT
jgi:predicted deacylase